MRRLCPVHHKEFDDIQDCLLCAAGIPSVDEALSGGVETRAVKKGYFYVQHGYLGDDILWWRRGRKGYTPNVDDAHVFTKAEAEEACSNEDRDDQMWPKAYVDEHVEKHANSETMDRAVAMDKTGCPAMFRYGYDHMLYRGCDTCEESTQKACERKGKDIKAVEDRKDRA